MRRLLTGISLSGLLACGGSTEPSPLEGTAVFKIDQVTCTYTGNRNVTFYIDGDSVGMQALGWRSGRRYLPLIATLGLFILTSNLMGLIPGLVAPTANLNTTAACALIVFITYHVIGVRKQGFIPYMKHFAGPVPAVLKPYMGGLERIGPA